MCSTYFINLDKKDENKTVPVPFKTLSDSPSKALSVRVSLLNTLLKDVDAGDLMMPDATMCCHSFTTFEAVLIEAEKRDSSLYGDALLIMFAAKLYSRTSLTRMFDLLCKYSSSEEATVWGNVVHEPKRNNVE